VNFAAAPRKRGRESPLWIDRLVMLATGAATIDEVLAFASHEL
jgi:elongation factor P--beta-lysine ligase